LAKKFPEELATLFSSCFVYLTTPLALFYSKKDEWLIRYKNFLNA